MKLPANRVILNNNILYKISYLINVLSLLTNIIPFIVLYLLILPIARYTSYYRRKRKLKPRLVWGPRPIMNIKYLSNLLKRRYGYDSETVVYEIYYINKKDDFDKIINICDNYLVNKLFIKFIAYYVFLICLLKFDIFNYYYGGFLSVTFLKYFELKLLKLAGKKIILMQFGSDVTVPSYVMHKYKWNIGKVIYKDYPNYNEKIAIKNIKYFTNDADFIIGVGELVEFLPKFDIALPISSVIDPKEWKPIKIKTNNQTIKIVHAPNHPFIKGTEYLVKVYKKLKNRGYPIELILVKGMRNDRAKKIYENADIIADQFIIGWYALFAAEGMALGKPVLCYIRENLVKINKYALEYKLPILNTNPDNLEENLLRLIKNRGLRIKLGILGRKYIVNTVDYTIEQLHKIYNKLWGVGMI